MIRVHNPIKNIEVDSIQEIDIVNNVSLYDMVEIKKGQRVAQITLLEHEGYLFGIDTKDERDGGFGSTDKCKVVL